MLWKNSVLEDVSYVCRYRSSRKGINKTWWDDKMRDGARSEHMKYIRSVRMGMAGKNKR